MYRYAQDCGDGITLRIVNDNDAGPPRENMTTLGTLAMRRERYGYCIGQDEEYGLTDYLRCDADIRDHLDGQDVRVLIPMYMADHRSSGGRLSVDDPIIGKRAVQSYLAGLSDDHEDSDHRYNAYLYATGGVLADEYGGTGIREARKAASYLTGEAQGTAYYVEGNVWGWEIEVDDRPDLGDSCWGYYCEPEGYVYEAGMMEVALVRQSIVKERRESAEMAARDIVTVRP